MNITIKVNSPNLIQIIIENLKEIHHKEMGKIQSGVIQEEFTKGVSRKFESEINKNCWFEWSAERNRKHQGDYIESWITKHFDLFYKPSYFINLRTFIKSLGLIITDKQEEISIEVDSNEFALMKNPLEKLESIREEYINSLVDYCYKYHKWS